jgi:hypothetical protein
LLLFLLDEFEDSFFVECLVSLVHSDVLSWRLDFVLWEGSVDLVELWDAWDFGGLFRIRIDLKLMVVGVGFGHWSNYKNYNKYIWVQLKESYTQHTTKDQGIFISWLWRK